MTDNVMYTIVSIVCDQLTDLELAVLNNVAQLDQSPFNRLFDYGKVASLFTEAEGTRMHDATKEMLAKCVMERLG